MTPSEQYLKPCTSLGNAKLQLSVTGTKEPKFIIEIFDEKLVKQPNGTELLIPCSPRSLEALYFVPDRFKHGYHSRVADWPKYEVPITDYTVNLINKAWTNPKIISETAKPFFERILMREFLADQNAKRAAEFKEHKIVPTNRWFTEHLSKLALLGIELNPYQQVAAFNACVSKEYGLFMPAGTGKTAIMITKLDHVIEHSDRDTLTLVLCPKSVRTNWKNEIMKFSVNRDKIYITYLDGANPTDRAIKFITDVSSPEAQGKHIVLISGYESFVQTKKLHDLEFDLAILDESQNIANLHTKRTKTLLENRCKFKNKMDATGTPFRNTPFDVYSQFEFLGEGISGFDSLNAFKQFYGVYAQGYNGHTTLKSFKNIPLMQEKIAKYCFVISKEEALPFLPKKTESTVQCTMSDEQDQVYNDLAQALYAEIESIDNIMPDAVTVNNILTKLLRLAQVTSGFVKTDNGAINRFDPNPKLDLLIDYLKGCDNDDNTFEGVLTDPLKKAIVWCCFRQNVSQIHARLKLEGINSVVYHGGLDQEQRDAAVEQFNCNPDCKVFVGTAASGGVGLNLVGFDPYNHDRFQTNTTDVIYYSYNYSYVQRAQSQERAHRFITRVPVHITNLIVPGSIDEDIYDRLQYKRNVDLTLQDIKGILKSILKVKV